MGTRADFYVGRGKEAEWIGSIANDGYPSGIEGAIKRATTELDFRAAVGLWLDIDDSSSRPDDGWPWPWDDSRTTDYAYAFDSGRVYASCFGGEWFDPLEVEPSDDKEGRAKVAVFPDMSSRKNVTLGKRSGLIVGRC